MATTIAIGNNEKSALTKIGKLGFTSYTARMYEPQTQNTFAFEFLFDPGQVAYIATFANNMISPITGAEEISTTFNKGLAQINEILNCATQQLTAPTKTIGQVIIDFFNSQIKYAGKPTYSNANITMNTLIGLGSKNVLAAWADICLNERTLAGGWARTEPGYTPPVQGDMEATVYMDTIFSHIGYKVDGMLLECARDGSIVNSWKYIGMWVSSFTPGSYNMAGSNTPSQVTATITVDKIEQANLSYVQQNSYTQYAAGTAGNTGVRA